METTNLQSADPMVTQRKFEEELTTFHQNEAFWRSKGVFLVKSGFPDLEVLFTTPAIHPPSVVFCVRINFTNYDAEPLAVAFINPFTRELVRRKEIGIQFIQGSLFFIEGNPQPQLKHQDLLQGGPEDLPFFCMRGFREYHNNAVHTGDSWFLYRGEGIGTLHYVLDQLYCNSIPTINAHKVELKPVIGFQQQLTLRQS